MQQPPSLGYVHSTNLKSVSFCPESWDTSRRSRHIASLGKSTKLLGVRQPRHAIRRLFSESATSPPNPSRCLFVARLIEIEIKVTLDVSPEYLQFIPSLVFIRDALTGRHVITQPVPIGGKQMIPLSPGGFVVTAKLGGVESGPQPVDIKPGEVTKVAVLFGK